MSRKRIVIVDGYNVIHRVPALRRHLGRSLDSAREALSRYCSRWRSRRRDVLQVKVVFDGDSSVVCAGNRAAYGVREIYTRTKEAADDRILALIKESRRARECVVVSDDGYVSGNSRRLGAEVMTVFEFYRSPAVGEKVEGGELKGAAKSSLSPLEEKEINEDLKKIWGID